MATTTVSSESKVHFHHGTIDDMYKQPKVGSNIKPCIHTDKPSEDNMAASATTPTSTEVRFNKDAADDNAVEVRVVSDRKQSGSSSDSRRGRRCCPKLFDRASGSWWNPKFDSSLIEKEFKRSSLPQIRRRFRYALCYIILACIVWMIYLAVLVGTSGSSDGCQNWWGYFVGFGVLIILCVLLILFTRTKFYQKMLFKTHFVLACVLAGLVLATFAYDPECTTHTMSAVATFAVCVEIILLMYTVIPLPFLPTVVLMSLFSVAYEALYFSRYDPGPAQLGEMVTTKIFLHMCVHLMGIHIFFMQQVRSRSTFMKIGQALVARKQHQNEKELKMAAIHHLMPAVVAEELLSKEENDPMIPRGVHKPFRPFYMNRMENVSILFADIAGFTRMSANKEADRLVFLLNDLFGRFDLLCAKNKCEKICTLGDCYYCVSGCPQERDDHAVCCVEMGLCMVESIKEFCAEMKEDVNMRVGIHTGTVLCGVMGSRRFKFDVWSGDVNIANKMEASGEPGKVHVSEKTAKFLGDKYILKENRSNQTPMLLGARMKTYFIEGVKDSKTDSDSDANQSAESPEDGSPQNGASSKPLLAKPGTPPVEEESKPPPEEIADKSKDEDGSANLERGPGVWNKHQYMRLDSDEIPNKGPENGGPSPTPSLLDIIQDQNCPQNNALKTGSNPGGGRDSDAQFVESVQTEGKEAYFYKPPVGNLLLAFDERSTENLFRAQFNPNANTRSDPHQNGGRHPSETISTNRYNTVFDVGIGCAVYFLIAIGCFLVFQKQVYWTILFLITLLLQLFVLLVVLRDAFFAQHPVLSKIKLSFFHLWYPRHIIGALILGLPAFAVFINSSCSTETGVRVNKFYLFIIVVALLHFCNFIQLNSWMKTVLAVLCAVVMWAILFISIKQCPEAGSANGVAATGSPMTTPASSPNASMGETMSVELAVVLILLLILVWFLNREFEISFRLNYYGGVKAAKDKEEMQVEKKEAETLLGHIIPSFVTEQMGSSDKYSQNHRNVAVIFASVINFNDFFEETYKGGKECIRFLHELISDFDSLLDENRFKDVEKIKTIGSTYMAACGLHPKTSSDEESNKDLLTMMEFAIEMMDKLQMFNDEGLRFTQGAFKFILRIGYNHGELTSGVIGTTKKLYDIWGDTVNVASRMDSTGVASHVQVREDTMKVLHPYYEFKYAGVKKVRGKGDMITFHLIKKRKEPLELDNTDYPPKEDL